MKKTIRSWFNASRPALATLIVVLGLTLSSAIAPAFADAATAYSGRAFGLSVSTPLTQTTTLADTGQLPQQGGENDATLLTVNTQYAEAEVLLSVTMGFDNSAESEAALADVTLLPGTSNQITVDFLRAHSMATCTGVSGDSEIVNLQMNGQSIAVSGQPNQTVSVPGVLTLVINEETSSSGGGTNSITVNALDLTLLNGIGIIVSSAHSDITCGSNQPTPTAKDFMTGGGFITTNNAKDNFGFVAGLKPGQTTPSGQLNYVDHGTGMHVKSSDITQYSGNGNCRTFSGPASVDDQSGYTFTVTACDNRDSGSGGSTFSLTLSPPTNGYTASGPLSGGNIELHT